jgi:large subunit ribosomal protein L24
MKAAFSKDWKGSTQPRKQRKYAYNAPLHIASKFLSVHLSKELREKYNTRNIRVKTGDKVKVVRGTYKGRTGKVSKVSLKRTKVFVEGIEITKKEGNKSFIPIKPASLIIIELDLNDSKRKQKLESGVKNG